MTRKLLLVVLFLCCSCDRASNATHYTYPEGWPLEELLVPEDAAPVMVGDGYFPPEEGEPSHYRVEDVFQVKVYTCAFTTRLKWQAVCQHLDKCLEPAGFFAYRSQQPIPLPQIKGFDTSLESVGGRVYCSADGRYLVMLKFEKSGAMKEHKERPVKASSKYLLRVTDAGKPNQAAAKVGLEARYCNIKRGALEAAELCPAEFEDAAMAQLQAELEPLLVEDYVDFPKEWPDPSVSVPPGVTRNFVNGVDKLQHKWHITTPMTIATREGVVNSRQTTLAFSTDREWDNIAAHFERTLPAAGYSLTSNSPPGGPWGTGGTLRYDHASSGLVLTVEYQHGMPGLEFDEGSLQMLEATGTPVLCYEGYSLSIHDETP